MRRPRPDPPSIRGTKSHGRATQHHLASNAEGHLCPVALVYSAVNDAGDSKFPAEFIERVRRLEYRQFLFLPKGGPLTVDSLARFDEIQSVAENQLEPTEYALSTEVQPFNLHCST